MKKSLQLVLLSLVGLLACTGHKTARAQTLFIAHPDQPDKKVEYFLEKPQGNGPWPLIVLLHGYQEQPSAGGHDFVKWGVLDQLADRGYLVASVSQPGYGNSSGPSDFCGPFTQHAVSGVIAKLRAEGYVKDDRILIQGVSRGALVGGLIAAHDPSIRGIVLISGEYDLMEYVRHPKSAVAASVVDDIKLETSGTDDALRERSLLYSTQNIRASALILNGAKDDRTDPEQANQLAKAINAHGGHARAIIYPAFGHQIPVDVRNKDIDPFIEQVLKR